MTDSLLNKETTRSLETRRLAQLLLQSTKGKMMLTDSMINGQRQIKTIIDAYKLPKAKISQLRLQQSRMWLVLFSMKKDFGLNAKRLEHILAEADNMDPKAFYACIKTIDKTLNKSFNEYAQEYLKLIEGMETLLNGL